VAARLLQVVVFPYRGCSFTAVTRVQIPSGTPNLINNLRRANRHRQGPKGSKLRSTNPSLDTGILRRRSEAGEKPILLATSSA
jgi:hypothetical protein